MAAEENEEEQEDVLALTQAAAVATFPRGDGGEVGETDVETDAEPVPVETGDGRIGGQTAGQIGLERPERDAGELAEDEDGGRLETLWKEGPVWSVRSVEPEIDAAGRQALPEQIQGAEDGLRTVETAEAQARRRTAGDADGAAEALLEGTRQAVEAQAGLEGLYRQTVQGARPAAPALPPEQAGRSARAQEPGSAAPLAVDELDRAVRRDSRRYDGGMSIF